MSYGQKKKFLIAFGLATNTRVLILDEPTNGLGIPSKSQFRKFMAAALDEDKTTFVVVLLIGAYTGGLGYLHG